MIKKHKQIFYKMHKFLIFYFFIISIFSFSQKSQGKAIYNVKTNYSLKNITNKNEKQVINSVFEELKKGDNPKFELLFNGDESVFFGQQSLKKGRTKMNLIRLLSKVTGLIYIDLSKDIVIQKTESFDTDFKIRKNLKDYKWVITNEKLQLGKYTCYKAILKHNHNKVNNTTIAWFTKEISVNIGPNGYCGLPGLIVILKDDIFIYTLENLYFNLSKKEKEKIYKPKKGIEVTKKEYDSIYKILRTKKEKYRN